MAQLKNVTISDSDFLQLPVGTTAQRPASPTNGDIRYNSSLNIPEQYVGSKWKSIPNIVEGGLLLHLDASEPASYPGTGTTWFDLSGNGNNGTINSGVTYNSAGYFTFSGTTNGSVQLPLLTTATTNITMLALVNMPESEGGAIFYNGNIAGYGFGVGGTQFDDVGNDAIGLFQAVRWIDTNIPWGSGWAIVGMQLNAYGVPSFVKNGVTLASVPGTNANTPVTNAFLGTDSNSGKFFAGDIAWAVFYNRQLSAQEMAQNFSALRGRSVSYSGPAINDITPSITPSITYLDFASFNGTATTSNTFTGMSFGTEEANRYVAVAVHAFYQGSGRNITSVTVGGVAATEVIATTENVSQTFAYAGIWVADVTGTSGDVVITSDSGVDSWGAGTFKLIANNSTPTATARRTDNASASASFTLNYDTVSLAVSQGVNDINPTWTNATKQYGNDIRTGEWASAAIPTIVNSSGTVSVNQIDGAVVATWN